MGQSTMTARKLCLQVRWHFRQRSLYVTRPRSLRKKDISKDRRGCQRWAKPIYLPLTGSTGFAISILFCAFEPSCCCQNADNNNIRTNTQRYNGYFCAIVRNSVILYCWNCPKLNIRSQSYQANINENHKCTGLPAYLFLIIFRTFFGAFRIKSRNQYSCSHSAIGKVFVPFGRFAWR